MRFLNLVALLTTVLLFIPAFATDTVELKFVSIPIYDNNKICLFQDWACTKTLKVFKFQFQVEIPNESDIGVIYFVLFAFFVKSLVDTPIKLAAIAIDAPVDTSIFFSPSILERCGDIGIMFYEIIIDSATLQTKNANLCDFWITYIDVKTLVNCVFL